MMLYVSRRLSQASFNHHCYALQWSLKAVCRAALCWHTAQPQQQLSITQGGLCCGVSTASQSHVEFKQLDPYIPVWCLLPEVPAKNAVVRSTEFLCGAYSYSHLPAEKYPEVAVVGRSNVGKSSLINYLVGSNTLAKVSKHPGKTQSINHYLVNRSWCLVDCPGYGYAKVSKDTRADWNAFTQQYFKSRGTLTDVLLLVDASLPPKEEDLAGVGWLTKRGLPVTLVFTKIDKVKPQGPSPAQNILDFRAALEATGGPLSIPPHFATSSAAKKGKQALLMYLAQRRAKHAQQMDHMLSASAQQQLPEAVKQ